MTTDRRALARPALLGAVSGARTFTGLTALALTTTQHQSRQPERAYGSWPSRALTAALAGLELVGDKRPQTPSRLEALPLSGRLAAAAMCGALVSRRSTAGTAPVPMLLAAGIATAAAAGECLLGVRWRAWAGSELGSDLPGALIEDAFAVAAAWAASKQSPTHL